MTKDEEMTLTALEFPDITPSTDSPELAAFKEKVRELAKRHSRASHCGSIKAEMDELGVKEEAKVKVTVETDQHFTFTVPVEPSLLVGKTAEEQAQVLAGLIGKVTLSAGPGISIALSSVITVSPESIIRMEREIPPVRVGPVGVELGPRDVWRYTSSEGRVLHVWRGALRHEGDLDLETQLYVYTPCGSSAYTMYLVENSTRGTGDYCSRCLRSLRASSR